MKLRVMVFCLGLGWITAVLSACGVSSPGETTIPAQVPNGETAELLQVIDGDTIEVELESEVYRVRYIGVDTPERDEPFYQEASDTNRQLVEGQTLILVKDVSETDQFGRLLRYVYLEDGTFVNAELIRLGMARLVTFPPDVAQQEYFASLQQMARETQTGLWAQSDLLAEPDAPCACTSNLYNCTDFTNRQKAQSCFDYCQQTVGEDIHHLDGGGDGLVCESLP